MMWVYDSRHTGHCIPWSPGPLVSAQEVLVTEAELLRLVLRREEAWEKLDKMGEGGKEDVAGAKTKKSLLGSLHEKLICSAKDSEKPVA